MRPHSRREFLELALAGPAGLPAVAAMAAELDAKPVDIHQQILELAARQEEARNARFAAVKSRADLVSLQCLLQRYGDIAQVMAEIAPRRILIAAGIGGELRDNPAVSAVPGRFSQNPQILTDWIGD